MIGAREYELPMVGPTPSQPPMPAILAGGTPAAASVAAKAARPRRAQLRSQLQAIRVDLRQLIRELGVTEAQMPVAAAPVAAPYPAVPFAVPAAPAVPVMAMPALPAVPPPAAPAALPPAPALAAQAAPANAFDVLNGAWQWLMAALRSAMPPAPPPPAANAPGGKPGGPTRFVISSFNLLSSSAGASKGYAPAAERMQGAVEILKQHNVSVVGMQEMRTDQLADFQRLAGDTYGTFTGTSGERNYFDTTIAWRKDTWDLVKGGRLAVPSYGGRPSTSPYVLLRNKQTGQEAYFVDAHNPADTRNWHHQDGYRVQATQDDGRLVAQLMQQTGLPVFLVGDMNATQQAADIIEREAPVVAANAVGPHPAHAGIDWIFGSKGVQFDHYERVRDALVQRTTDHAVVFSQATISGH